MQRFRFIKQGRATFSALLILSLFYFGLVNAEPQTSPILHPKGLLWKIQRHGYPDSYLFGTIHLSTPRVISLVDQVSEHLQATDIFIMEMLLNDNSQNAMANASFFPAGETLAQHLDESVYHRVLAIMGQYYGVPENVVSQMRPWAVMVTISAPPPENNQPVLDVELQNVATDLKMPSYGLETVEEQLMVLSGMPLFEQVWLLNHMVADYEQSINMWDDLIRHYLDRDLAALVNSQQVMMDDSSDIDDRFMYALLDQRNRRMADRLQQYLVDRSVFVAIGALHLPGENGVLHLLEQAGYQVTPVY